MILTGYEQGCDEVVFAPIGAKMLTLDHDKLISTYAPPSLAGGTVNPESLPHLSLIDVWIRRAREKCETVVRDEFLEPRNVVFGVTSTLKSGGKSWTSGTVDGIAISAGAVGLLHEGSARLLRSPDMWPEVGEPAFEAANQVPTPLYVNHELSDGHWDWPSCQVRKCFAQYLATITFDFLFSHELAHIERGHLKLQTLLIERHTCIREHWEILADPLSRQAFELDADIQACGRTLRAATWMRQNAFRALNAPDPLRDAIFKLYADPRRLIYFVVFCMMFVWRVQNQQYWEVDALARSTHPPVPVRMLFAIARLAGLLHQDPMFDISSEALKILLRHAFASADKAFRSLTGEVNHQDWTGALQEGTKTFEHLTSLTKRYLDLQPIIARHQWGEVGAPGPSYRG